MADTQQNGTFLKIIRIIHGTAHGLWSRHMVYVGSAHDRYQQSQWDMGRGREMNENKG